MDGCQCKQHGYHNIPMTFKSFRSYIQEWNSHTKRYNINIRYQIIIRTMIFAHKILDDFVHISDIATIEVYVARQLSL